MTLVEVQDLMAYFRTLPPVFRPAPDHRLSPLFRLRWRIGLWKALFFDLGRGPALSGDQQLDRGAYLVETLGHCAKCHSTRNLLGAIREEARFAGEPDPEGVGFVPNITPQAIGRWSEADLVELLRSGKTPDHGAVGSSMRDVVENTARLPESDRTITGHSRRPAAGRRSARSCRPCRPRAGR